MAKFGYVIFGSHLVRNLCRECESYGVAEFRKAIQVNLCDQNVQAREIDRRCIQEGLHTTEMLQITRLLGKKQFVMLFCFRIRVYHLL